MDDAQSKETIAAGNGGARKHAIVAYVPALHQGYFNFFKQYPGSLYLLGSDFIREAPRLERDIRALAPEEVKAMLDGTGIFSRITVLQKENFFALENDPSPIVMPNEDISRAFARQHLAGRNAAFVPIFLRWDRQISTAEFEVPPDRIISANDFDKEIMAAASEEAEKSPDWWRQIGAILIRDKKPVLIRHNTPIPQEYTPNIFGDPRSNFDAGEAEFKDLGKFVHAEAGIIAEAARRGIPTDGASLYATTFPCPACAKSIAVAGIKEVYYAKGYSLLDAEDVLRTVGVKIVLVG